MTSGNDNRSFRPGRAAAVAAGVVVFLLLFRPFGIAVDSIGAALVLLGLAPLNFLIMYAVHSFDIRSNRLRTAIAMGSIVAGNTAYLVAWSQGARVLEISSAVVLVVGLSATMVFLWNRGSIPEQEIDGRGIGGAGQGKLITLRGESPQELLQLSLDELLYISANGNYVDVHYRKGADCATMMLRSSLTRLADQVPGKLLLRCHRSHFVNLAVARRIVRKNGRTLIEFDGGVRVPVSRKLRKDVIEALAG